MLEETARRHDGDGTAAFLGFDGQEEEEEGSDDDEGVLSDEEGWEEVLAETVVSRPVWPPPAAALAGNQDLADLVRPPLACLAVSPTHSYGAPSWWR